MAKEITSPVLAGLKGNDREIMKAQLVASGPLLRRLEELIKKEIDALDTKDPDFNSPSWAYEQAFKLGLKKGLTSLSKYVIINS